MKAAGAPQIFEAGGRCVPVVYLPTPRARRITLRADPRQGRITVTYPRAMRPAKAMQFFDRKRDWLTRQVEGWPEPQPLVNEAIIPFMGEDVRIRHDVTAPRTPLLSGGVLTVGGPADMLAGRVERWLRAEAKRVLDEDTRACAAKLGRRVGTVSVRDTVSRWGSCNISAGRINYSWRLILAPPFVRQAVVAHEVAHLVHAGHGPEFHRLADELAGGTQARSDAWLRAHGAGLHRIGR